MDLYTLDSAFHKKDVIDAFESLIWTERYSEPGDMTLVVPSNTTFKDILVEGAFLSIPESREVVLVDTVSEEDGALTITGKTLVDFLRNRIIRNPINTQKDTWKKNGSMAQIAGDIVSNMCKAGDLMATGAVKPNGDSEVIPNLVIGPLATGASTSISLSFGNLYDAVKMVCDIDSLGFSLYPDNITDTGYNMRFTDYAGLDRTTGQSTNSVVIFEPALDSLTGIKKLRSIAGYINNVYVWPAGYTGTQSQIGYASVTGAGTTTGFKRRTLGITASDINVADYSATDLATLLTQRAKDTLANNNYVRMMDGQVVPQSAFVYGVDYNLGDIIELRDGATVQSARVTEYIRTEDSSGEIAYPTLATL